MAACATVKKWAPLAQGPADGGRGAGREQGQLRRGPARAEAAASASELPAEELIRQYVPHQHVTAFAWSVIRHIVPPVGSKPSTLRSWYLQGTHPSSAWPDISSTTSLAKVSDLLTVQGGAAHNH